MYMLTTATTTTTTAKASQISVYNYVQSLDALFFLGVTVIMNGGS